MAALLKELKTYKFSILSQKTMSLIFPQGLMPEEWLFISQIILKIKMATFTGLGNIATKCTW